LIRESKSYRSHLVGLRYWLVAVTLLFYGFSAEAQQLPPLPQDTGTAGLKQMLLRLQTTARLMQIDAHPDDEDGGMLTLESRGKGATVTLLTLNRGEGGQNKLGSDLFDVLGVLRTLEVTAADQYYGIHQRFTRVADFGFSKSPDETFQKWGGHDTPLADIVRVIRTFRPDVLVARFSGTPRDGHGHHQASAILTKEAFRAAADPNRFPEQIKEGLRPWQAKKLYIGNVCGFRSDTCPDENWTVRLNTGTEDPALGMSYIQFAMEGLRHQQSQGAGGWSVPPGPHYSFYKLVDSTLPQSAGQYKHESNFFYGIDTSLPGLASGLGREEDDVPFLKPALLDLQNEITRAAKASSPASATGPLLEGLAIVRKTILQINGSKVSSAAKEDLLPVLETKQEQLEEAANLAGGVRLTAVAEGPIGASADEAITAVPGRNLNISLHFSSESKASLKEIALDLPSGWKATEIRHQDDSAEFRVSVPENAQLTKPYWHRNDPQVESVNIIDQPQYATLPFAPPQIKAHAIYSIAGKPGVVHAVVMARYQEDGSSRERPLAVTPLFSVLVNPGEDVLPVSATSSKVTVQVRSSVANPPDATLHLEVPAGWRVEPRVQRVEHLALDKDQNFDFQVFSSDHKPQKTQIRAILEAAGKQYGEGFTLVTREDLGSAYYYQPALQRVSVVDVKVPKTLKVGYVMGAGDDIATVLKQVGMDVTFIAADQLASEDLSQFGTIVLGIRAYDTQKDVAENNTKLLNYVSQGGTLVVQYNADTGDFNSGHFMPFPAELSHARVTVEEVPVTILAPDDGSFHFPNEITQSDFQGWVQERGLYFMDQWDGHFKPLLACNDPGEPPQKGGLMRAQYGKGTYIYTGYSFFRQLPAGVPGAVRLFVNIVSAGHDDQ
jgi:LmbE family N-acetylglucosaminyl deacetylase